MQTEKASTISARFAWCVMPNRWAPFARLILNEGSLWDSLWLQRSSLSLYHQQPSLEIDSWKLILHLKVNKITFFESIFVALGHNLRVPRACWEVFDRASGPWGLVRISASPRRSNRLPVEFHPKPQAHHHASWCWSMLEMARLLMTTEKKMRRENIIESVKNSFKSERSRESPDRIEFAVYSLSVK